MKSNQIVLLDGGIGQEIYKRAGSPESQTLWSLQVMRDNPETVIGVHVDFINAGSKERIPLGPNFDISCLSLTRSDCPNQ